MIAQMTTATPDVQLPVPGADFFHGTWQIGRPMPGGKLLTVHLMFDTRNEMVTGFGESCQVMNPIRILQSRLEGAFIVHPDMDPVQINLSVANPEVAPGSEGPVIPRDVTLTIVLMPGWNCGTATFYDNPLFPPPVRPQVEVLPVELVAPLQPA